MTRSQILAGLLAGLVASAAHAQINQDLRCFKSKDGGAIRFEFHMFDDPASDWTGGYVRYRGAKHVIPVVLKSEHATELVAGRPDEFDRVWVEIVDGKVTGEYAMNSQGAIVNSMRYTKLSSRRSVEFVDDPGADTDGGCHW